MRGKAAILAFWFALLTPGAVLGFGVEGHRIAGRVAQTRLCDAAAGQVELLSGGQSLANLGLWADRIRSEGRWAHSAPWHYMNVTDDLALERYETPQEGDVLWAVTHFGVQLANDLLASERRLEALRFLTHFVVDIHQPLHVGRAADRGGNQIRVTVVNGLEMNLHRFWDSEAIRLAGLSEDAYVDDVRAMVEANANRWEGHMPSDWAEESRNLRSRVYDLDGDRLSMAYLDTAVNLVRLRLSQASVRLAAEINRLLCD